MYRNLLLNCCALLLLAFWGPHAMTLFPETATESKPGAENKTELAEVVFNAFKLNDFNMLATYLPGENELNYLKKKSPQDKKDFYASLSTEVIKANVKENFSLINKKGIEKEVNWSTIELLDTEEKKLEDTNINDYYKVMLLLQDMQGKKMSVEFETIKIKGKWFLLEGLMNGK